MEENKKGSKRSTGNKILLCIIAILILSALALGVYYCYDNGIIFDRKVDNNKANKENNNNNNQKQEETKKEINLHEFCDSTIVEGSYTSKDHTFVVSYETDAESDNDEIGHVYVIIKNEDGLEVLHDDCYSLGNAHLLGYAINSDDTITALYSDGADDTHNFIVSTIDYNGTETNRKDFVCESQVVKIEKDLEAECVADV